MPTPNHAATSHFQFRLNHDPLVEAGGAAAKYGSIVEACIE